MDLNVDVIRIIARFAFRPPKEFCGSAEEYVPGLGLEWMAGIERWKNITFSQMVICCANPFRLHSMGAAQSLLEALRLREKMETAKANEIWQERERCLGIWQAAATRGDRVMLKRGMKAIETSLNDLYHAYGVYARELFRFGQIVTYMGTLYITGEMKDR